MNIRLVPFNARGAAPMASIAPIALTTGARASAPYPPGNVKVNGSFWPTSTTGNAVLTWAHRRKEAETGYTIVYQDAGDVGSPDGTYTVDVFVGGTLKHTTTAIAGTTFTYTTTQRTTDDADATKTVVLRITPIGATGTAGTARSTDPFLMT